MATESIHSVARRAVQRRIGKAVRVEIVGRRVPQGGGRVVFIMRAKRYGCFAVEISPLAYDAGNGIVAWMTHTNVTPIAIPAGDVTPLRRLEFLLPTRHREALIGDLREDVAAKRHEGWSEKQLASYVRWQLFCIIVEWLKPWRWGWGAAAVWIIHKLSK